MPNLHEVSREYANAKEQEARHEMRLRYLQRLQGITKRNIILYYSGWLQKPGREDTSLNDSDIHSFMSAVSGLDYDTGLDLVLHTPGGEVAATEALVDYLRNMFGTNIRVIVPQMAMSAGTMIACAAKTILMGKHSSLGPIDPQIMGVSADGVVREFRRAYKEITEDSGKIHLWGPIIAQYSPFMVTECEQVIKWGNDLACKWLETGMFESQIAATRKSKAKEIVKELADNSRTKSHSRHLSAEFCKKLGLQVEMIERDQNLQDAVLSIHHVCALSLTSTPATKLIMNHEGVGVVESA